MTLVLVLQSEEQVMFVFLAVLDVELVTVSPTLNVILVLSIATFGFKILGKELVQLATLIALELDIMQDNHLMLVNINNQI
jgi:hypothetical protein